MPVAKREIVRTPAFCKRCEELLVELGSYQAVADRMNVKKWHVEQAIRKGPHIPVALRRKQEATKGERIA